MRRFILSVILLVIIIVITPIIIKSFHDTKEIKSRNQESNTLILDIPKDSFSDTTRTPNHNIK